MSNFQPVAAEFNQDGTLVKIWGPNSQVAFDPSSVAITGGVIGGNPVSRLANASAAVRAARVAAFAAGPAVVAPAIAGSATTYAQDQVVRLASGVHLSCSVAGTSSGTAPVPSATVTDGRPISDGTVTWYMNGMFKAASDITAPTMTSAASAAAAGLTETKFVSGGLAPVLCNMRGAQMVNFSNAYVGPFTVALGNTSFSGNATANANAAGYSGDAFGTSLYSVETLVTDHKFGVTFHNTSGRVVIEIDGQVVSADPFVQSGTPGSGVVFDYAGVVKRRLVRVSVIGGPAALVRGVMLSAQGYAEAPGTSSDTMLCLGDSYFDTAVPALQTTGHLGYYLQRYLGVQEMVLANVGGSGYIVANANTYNVGAVLSNANNRTLFGLYNPSHVFINAGFNDRAGNSVASIKAAALGTWQAIRAQFPAAKITVGDGWSGSGGPDANSLAVSQGLADQFAAWGDSNSRMVRPVTTSTATAYVQGAGNAGTALTTGNASMMICTDTVHPSPAGVRYIASRLAADISAAWSGNY